MADLPENRLVPDKPPFTTVGVDCFGRFHIHCARSLVKDMEWSLQAWSSTQCILRLLIVLTQTRFSSHSDVSSPGGVTFKSYVLTTNFTTGERELRESVQAWNHDKIHEEMLERNIKWSFNPPYGLHHGGFLERCIRSIRRILRALLLEQTKDDEGLTPLMCEVESILNSRPITVVSEDSRDLEPLTPNHLLLLK